MVERLAARNGGRAGLLALAAVLLLGLGLRIGEAWDGRPPVYDARAYAAIAANLEDGNGFTVGPDATQPSSNYSPGLPLFVAAVYGVSGGVHERLARVVLGVIGALSILFAYLIARRLLRLAPFPGQGQERSPVVWPALAGAAAVAVYPALLEYQGMLMGEPLAATLLSGGVLAALWAWDGPRGRLLLPGALFGGLALVRPEYLGIAALVALAILARRVRVDARGSLLRALVFGVGVTVVIAPWTIRNAAALDRFVPISTGGGQVLYAGTYLPSDGNPERVGADVVAHNPDLFSPADAKRLRLEQILARLAERERPTEETEGALSQMGKEQLWDDVSRHPGEYADFVATKIGRIWFHGARNVMRAPAWVALQWALVVFGLLGLGLLAWHRRWEALLIGTVFLAVTAISAILVASPRRVLVLVPLLGALAALAVDFVLCLPRRDKTRTRPGEGAPAGRAGSLSAP